MESIVVLGANPAWQRNVVCAALLPGEVVRLRKGADGAAGKGFNCAQALRGLGSRVVLVSGIGTDRAEWEAACSAGGLELRGFALEGPVRRATTVRDLSTGSVTELVEEGPGAAAGAAEEVVGLLSRDASFPACACGTLPSGLEPDSVARALAVRDGILVVDSLPLVRALLAFPPRTASTCLKLNESEWLSLGLGGDLDGIWSSLRGRWPGIHLLCTRGARGSVGEDSRGMRVRVPAPALPEGVEVHPIGAGDAYTAGFVHVWGAGGDFSAACRSGAAAARASCRNPLPSRLDLEHYRESLDRIADHV